MKVELIYDPDCPNVEATRQELSTALKQTNLAGQWHEWNRRDPACPEYAKGYGSPTVLIDGKDIQNQQAAGEISCCRLYQDANGGIRGAPSQEQLKAALQRRNNELKAATDGTKNGGGWSAVGVLPALGAGFLPVAACPACWPAYAGVLGSVGLGFLIEARYLLPLTVLFFGLALLALGYQAKQRHGYGPLGLGIVAAMTVLVSKFVLNLPVLTYVGLGVLVLASIWNIRFKKGTPESGSCSQCASAGKTPLEMKR